LQPIGIEKGISIINHINPKLPLIVSDHSKCLHILQNIIGNAIKFTNEGTVEISADVDNKFIHISVKDTGIGISVENKPYIFDEFRQADDKASRVYGGTGLGLAIASKYCNMLQGKVEVESQLHKGSVFTVTLPIMPDHLQIDENETNIKPFTDKTITPPAVSLKPVKGKNILLVEDNEAAIIQMKDILMNDEYNIRIANNGKEALEIIPSFVPDAIILDLMMPEVDGFDVLVSIRKMKETSKIPVLILSAKHVTNEELGMLRGNHIYQLIQKGDINKNELLGHIRNMVTMKNTEKTDLLSLNPDLASGFGKKSILVIEDNLDNMETVKALLVNEHEIIEALDGLDGLGKAKKLLPDLILMDISLPGMDGVEVLKEIKKDKKIQNIPVIALTARVMNGDREELLAHGFDDYISKPIDNAVLERTINEWLHGN
ncbi:MAG: response regulator, partial [Bacteroidota bacterium]|nr:response regulator [Bacteroidota bacterium]